MIVLLAILNDGAILSIAYDRVDYSNRPEKWDMRFVMGVARCWALFAVMRSFGIFYIGDHDPWVSMPTSCRPSST